MGGSSSAVSQDFRREVGSGLSLITRCNYPPSGQPSKVVMGILEVYCTLVTRGGIWLQSQRPNTRVYDDYSLIIAINSSFSVNNRTRLQPSDTSIGHPSFENCQERC